jgi:hypothetical protein
MNSNNRAPCVAGSPSFVHSFGENIMTHTTFSFAEMHAFYHMTFIKTYKVSVYRDLAVMVSRMFSEAVQNGVAESTQQFDILMNEYINARIAARYTMERPEGFYTGTVSLV